MKGQNSEGTRRKECCNRA